MEQGEVGESFYIVETGSCQVLQREGLIRQASPPPADTAEGTDEAAAAERAFVQLFLYCFMLFSCWFHAGFMLNMIWI